MEWDGRSVNLNFLITVFIGVLFIGFLNFLVSFSLAFIVAVRSRGIHLREYPEFLQILWKYFRTHPLDFFRPQETHYPQLISNRKNELHMKNFEFYDKAEMLKYTKIRRFETKLGECVQVLAGDQHWETQPG